MINSPTANVKLTANDLIRLQKVEDRLANLITEIDIHTKLVTNVRSEVNSLDKEKTYLEEQIDSNKYQISVLQDKEKELVSTIDASNKVLLNLQKKSKTIEDSLSKREEAVKIKETEIYTKESELNILSEGVKRTSDELDGKKALVEKAKENLMLVSNINLW